MSTNTHPLSYDEFLQQRCDSYNQTSGKLNERDGYSCPSCNNRGDRWIISDGEILSQNCPDCTSIRKSIWLLKKSGLSDKTFDNFVVSEEWQRQLVAASKKFVQEDSGKWLYISGQSGSGKTHICTSVLKEFIFCCHKESLLFEWAEKAKELKRYINDPTYDDKLSVYKSVPVLYIDDFLKVKRGETPTAADINLAFELLDYRDRKSLTTIISSEFFINNVVSFDEALGSRIKFRAREYSLEIGRDARKNFRLKD